MSTSAAATRTPSKQRLRKEAMLASFTKMCTDAEGVIVAEYTGIDVASLADLRAAAKAADSELQVVKNTVAKRALAADDRFAPLADHLSGHLIYGAGKSAPALAKVLRDFAKENEELKVRFGAMEGELLESDQIKKLADLPSREELLATVAGTLNAPIVKLARTLAEVPAALARSLSAVRDAK